MHKIVSIFFYFVFTEWPSALAEPTINTDAEKAILDATSYDVYHWVQVLGDNNSLPFLCYELMLHYEKIEKFFEGSKFSSVNVRSKYVADMEKEVLVLQCSSTEDFNYLFTVGAEETYVRIEMKMIDGEYTYFIDQFIDPKPVVQWEYVHNMCPEDVPKQTKKFCQKIFAAHHPQRKYRAVHALRAIRNGIDVNYDPTMFQTLLCYYDSNNYIEYCEGQEDNQVSEVTYLGENVYTPKENSSIYVYY